MLCLHFLTLNVVGNQIQCVSSLTLKLKTSQNDAQVHIRLRLISFIITTDPLCTFNWLQDTSTWRLLSASNQLAPNWKKIWKIRFLFTITDSKEIPNFIKTHVLKVYAFVDLTYNDPIYYFLIPHLRAHKINTQCTIQTTILSAENNRISSSFKLMFQYVVTSAALLYTTHTHTHTL
jgi:hypothetical protein